MCRRVLQPLVSIDLFWRQLWVFRLEGLRREGPGLGWGFIARKVELPGRDGLAFGAWAGPWVSAP